ncbi:nucleoside triphosphate pyrophosphohydrolase [Marinomonas pollencensis]|uniref:Nucleoside triphosphate pyrophosphohydrolase n=1 Tax=Marinomonas pollencensis TaxID=491954 RepID=A0A3E0DU02_9GAMM|nr:nucleoside triphosphate pyrophosphohydrolase [Marinomonas pollencensis]REG86910.1 ATP diphosphatase [Marinomonas pollencensis]
MSDVINQLLTLMACLRDKQHGCPWDQQQTNKTIAAFTLEETYEVLDAIEREDHQHLKEELGDLLFQIVFYAQIGKEDGHFDFNDVVSGIVEKMLRRHPHVFPDGRLTSFGQGASNTTADLSAQWQAIKAEEKAGQQVGSLLDEVPVSMPALMQAAKLQKKASKVGFDWQDSGPVFAKIREELDELEAAIQDLEKDHIEAEMGDVLFAMSNLARHLKVSPDVALNRTNVKFRRRFARIESLLLSQNKEITDCSLEELDQYWEQAKAEGL